MGKGKFPVERLQKIQTPFYYYDSEVLRQTLKAINEEAGKHEGFVVHYAETFIIPACVGEYTIRPYGASEGKTCVTIKAYVRC